MKIVIFNGPRGTGKDTATDYMTALYPDAIKCRFKEPLYERSYAHFKISDRMSYEDWIHMCNDTTLKVKPCKMLKGKSPVQALIYVSEELIKKELGETGVSQLAVDYIKKHYPDYQRRLLVFSDGGFACEIKDLIERFDLTRKDICIVRLTRKGHTFEGDSRSYIPDFNLEIRNNESISTFLGHVRSDIGFFLQASNDHFEPEKIVTSRYVRNLLVSN